MRLGNKGDRKINMTHLNTVGAGRVAIAFDLAMLTKDTSKHSSRLVRARRCVCRHVRKIRRSCGRRSHARCGCSWFQVVAQLLPLQTPPRGHCEHGTQGKGLGFSFATEKTKQDGGFGLKYQMKRV